MLVHSDGGSYKPLNWMSPPCRLAEEPGRWTVTNKAGETLAITIEEVLSDYSADLGIDPGLVKDGVESHLQELLAAQVHVLGDGWRLIRREYPTPIGPVDLMCKDADGTSVAVEIKRRGEIDGANSDEGAAPGGGTHVAVEIKRHAGIDAVEQLTRYLELLNRDPLLAPVTGRTRCADDKATGAYAGGRSRHQVRGPGLRRDARDRAGGHAVLTAIVRRPAAAGVSPPGAAAGPDAYMDPMRALITNDDGIDSAGLRTLAQVAVAAGLKVTVAAPDGERSGSSAAMSGLAEGGRVLVEDRTLDGLADVRTVAVQASPAMIVFLGAHGAFGEPPDIVLAGINRGPNVGRAILHSGTVGAALTAQAAGLPAMAVSLASARAEHWDTAAAVATRALTWFLPHVGVTRRPGHGSPESGRAAQRERARSARRPSCAGCTPRGWPPTRWRGPSSASPVTASSR